MLYFETSDLQVVLKLVLEETLVPHQELEKLHAAENWTSNSYNTSRTWFP